MTTHLVPESPEAGARIEIAKEIFDEHPTVAIAMVRDGAPWVGRAFFVEDEPASGLLDVCCALRLDERALAMVRKDSRVAFIVGGESPDRWIQGSGNLSIVGDAEDAEEICARLREKAPDVEVFLRGAGSTAVRIRVERMRLIDPSASPPVAEFTFA